MAARPSWSGAIDLGGFPVNVRLYNRIGSGRKAEGLKMITPEGEPIGQHYEDSAGKKWDYAELGRGIERGGQIIPLTQDALDKMKAAERTTLATPAKFSPLSSIDLSLNTGSYKVLADSKVDGSKNSYKVLWNGLHDSDLAYVTKMVMRSGAADGILALFAKDDGIYAVGLPFESVLNDLPDAEVEKDERAANVFAAFIEAQYEDKIGDFDRSEFKSESAERRAEVFDAVLAGVDIEVPEVPEPTVETPDLMSALEGALKEQKPKARKKAPAKKARKTKAAA